MPSYVELAIQSGVNRPPSQIERDIESLLGVFRRWPLIVNCPSIMEIIAIYDFLADPTKLTLFFSHISLVEGGVGSARKFLNELNLQLKEAEISNIYKLTTVVCGVPSFIISSHCNNFKTCMTCYPVEPPRYIFTDKQKHPPIPGIVIQITKKPGIVNIEHNKLVSDAQCLVRYLSVKPIKINKALFSPVWLKEVSGQSFELIVPGFSFFQKERIDFIVQNVRIRLEEKSLHTGYFVSAIVRSSNCIENQAYTTNNSKALVEISFSDSDIPEKFLCSLTSQIMDEPVKLPSGVYVDKNVLHLSYIQNPVDPFTRQPLVGDIFKVDNELQKSIADFVKAATLKHKSSDHKVSDQTPGGLTEVKKENTDAKALIAHKTSNQEQLKVFKMALFENIKAVIAADALRFAELSATSPERMFLEELNGELKKDAPEPMQLASIVSQRKGKLSVEGEVLRVKLKDLLNNFRAQHLELLKSKTGEVVVVAVDHVEEAGAGKQVVLRHS